MLFNKVCDETDWNNERFQKILLNEFHLPKKVLTNRERKHWEWGMSFLALEKLGYLKENHLALGLGSGHEAFLFALSNHLHMVIATDLYGQSKFNVEADIGMHKNANQYCDFPYKKNRVLVNSMDAVENSFGNEQFDILFSFSSLEHFGSNSKIRKTMRHAYRVLKKGGIFCLSVDYIFKGPQLHRSIRPWKSGEFFTQKDIHTLILESAPFECHQEINFSVPSSNIKNIYDTVLKKNSASPYPHIHLKFFNYYFSSLLLLLFK